MTPTLRAVDRSLGAAVNLERDRAALDRGEPLVRVARLNDRSMTIGVSQRSDDDSVQRARSAGWVVHRRTSGGLGLLHLPGDVAWSVVLPRAHPLVGNDFACAYPRLGDGVVGALGRYGVRSAWEDPVEVRGSQYCLFGARGKVLRSGGRSLGGAAQHLTQRALLHHGVLNRSLDPEAMQALFGIGATILDQRLVSLTELRVPDDEQFLGTLVGMLADCVDAPRPSDEPTG